MIETNAPVHSIVIEQNRIDSAQRLAEFIVNLMKLGDGVFPECKQRSNDMLPCSMKARVVGFHDSHMRKILEFHDGITRDEQAICK